MFHQGTENQQVENQFNPPPFRGRACPEEIGRLGVGLQRTEKQYVDPLLTS